MSNYNDLDIIFDKIYELCKEEKAISTRNKLDKILKRQELEMDYGALLKVWYLMSDCGYNLEEALSRYEDVTFYDSMTLIEAAREMVEGGYYGEVPTAICFYIDFEKLANDLEIDGYTETAYGVFHYC